MPSLSPPRRPRRPWAVMAAAACVALCGAAALVPAVVPTTAATATAATAAKTTKKATKTTKKSAATKTTKRAATTTSRPPTTTASAVSTTTAPRTSAPAAGTSSTVAIGAFPTPPSPPAVGAPLQWQACARVLQCATLAVPSDPATPASPAVGLAVVRRPAEAPEHRIGVLVVNPGGPGGSAVDWVANASAALPAAVRQRFDVVGFDPRGVRHSGVISCGTPVVPFTTDESVRSFAAACTAHAARDLAQLSTLTTAADLEQLRVALGEDRISFLGYSYGTQLGLAYAQAHPERVRALVLDSPVDPVTTATDRVGDRMRALERSLDAFLAACSSPRARCAFNNGTNLRDRYSAVAQALTATPVRSSDGAAVIDREFFEGIVADLVSDTGSWAELAGFLQQVVVALIAPSQAAPFGDFIATARANAREAEPEVSPVVNIGTTCADDFYPRATSDLPKILFTAAELGPRFTSLINPLNSGEVCGSWPVTPRAPVTAQALPFRAVVVSAVFDVRTPTEWADRLAAATGATLVRYAGASHGLYRKSRCVTDLVTPYLLDGVAPPAGQVCQQ